MPPTGYLTTNGIESCLVYLRTAHPTVCRLFDLPELSREGRSMRAIRIAGGPRRRRPGVVFIAGCHARELVNPDLLVTFAFRLLRAYANNSSISFGPKTYSAIEVKIVVENLDLFIFPLVNPDGRIYVQTPAGDPWWRKNRSHNPGTSCRGVDLNRNYDFLWSSGIGTSPDPCEYQIYKGMAPFSEPETRNVRYLLDTPNVRYFVDVHSYTELILYPWGDDDNQTTNAAMSFTNPAFNGVRGVPGDAAYREYIPSIDQQRYVGTANRVRDAIAAVRGRFYTAKQGVGLYPTSGTSLDYAYSRHFVDMTRANIYGYLLETGPNQFQPPYAEARKIISEVSAGLFEFLQTCVCPVETVSAMRMREMAMARQAGAADTEQLELEAQVGSEAADADFDDLQAFSDFEMVESRAGQRYIKLLDDHASELVRIAAADADIREQVASMLERVGDVVRSRHDQEPGLFPDETIKDVAAIADAISERASEPLRAAIESGRGELEYFRNRTVMEALRLASEAEPRASE